MSWDKEPEPEQSEAELPVETAEVIRADWQEQLIEEQVKQTNFLYSIKNESKIANDSLIQMREHLRDLQVELSAIRGDIREGLMDSLADIATELQVLRSDIATHWPVDAEWPERQPDWKAQPPKMKRKMERDIEPSSVSSGDQGLKKMAKKAKKKAKR